MAAKKQKNIDDCIIENLPDSAQERLAKKFKHMFLEAKKTMEGRRRLAKTFGGNPSDYMK
jgi:hypothetical protein